MNTKKDTLYIIGNGFDLHHGLNTSYKNFRDNVVLKAPNLWKQLIDIYGDDVTKDMWWSDFWGIAFRQHSHNPDIMFCGIPCVLA